MEYIFREHYLLTPMQNDIDGITRVVVYEPTLELAQLYAKYLRLQEFEAHICGSHGSLFQLTQTLYPQILIYNIDRGLAPLTDVKLKHPSILVITIGDLAETELSKLMDLGVSGHINRRVTHPRDVGILARQLLTY